MIEHYRVVRQAKYLCWLLHQTQWRKTGGAQSCEPGRFYCSIVNAKLLLTIANVKNKMLKKTMAYTTFFSLND